MNQALAYLGLALFLTLPPAVFFVRYRLGSRMPWWVVAIVIAGGGWLFVNFANYFYGRYACEPVRDLWNTPSEALAHCVNDGARNVFALRFGWLYALLYSMPFFVVLRVAAWIRRGRAGTRRKA